IQHERDRLPVVRKMDLIYGHLLQVNLCGNINPFIKGLLFVLVAITPETVAGSVHCRSNGYALGKGKVEALFCQLHCLYVHRWIACKGYLLNAHFTNPATELHLPHPEVTVWTEYESVITHSQAPAINKRYTSTLQFSIDFLEHDPHDAVPVH